jgi:hypothetical protein
MSNITKYQANELTRSQLGDFYGLTEALVPEYEGDLMSVLGWSHRHRNVNGQLGPCLLSDHLSMDRRDVYGWPSQHNLVGGGISLEEVINKVGSYVNAPEFEQALAIVERLDVPASPEEMKKQIVFMQPGRPASRGISDMYTTMVVELLMSGPRFSLAAVIAGIFAARRGDDVEGFEGKRSLEGLNFMPSEAVIYQYVKAEEKKFQARARPMLLMKKRLQQFVDEKSERDAGLRKWLASDEHKARMARPFSMPTPSLVPEEILAEENAKSARRRADASLVAEGDTDGDCLDSDY